MILTSPSCAIWTTRRGVASASILTTASSRSRFPMSLVSRFLDGKWFLLPPGAYVYAGDMTERLTNGAVKAMKHRVRNSPSARGAHVFFTQPSVDLVIKVAEQYVSHQDPPLAPLKYGDWHDMKVAMAFGTTKIGTKA